MDRIVTPLALALFVGIARGQGTGSRPAPTAAAAVTGTVLDRSGQPAAGALVRVFHSRSGTMGCNVERAVPWLSEKQELTTTADGQGRFRFEGLPTVEMAAFAEGSDGELSAVESPVSAGQALVLRLLPPRRIAARVAADGPGGQPEPVAGARVVVTTPRGAFRATLSRADGSFELPIPGGDGMVQAFLGERCSLPVLGSLLGGLVPALKLFAMRRVAGVVVDQASGAPVPEAMVQWLWPPVAARSVTSTDAQGRFAMMLPAHAPAQLQVVPRDHARRIVELRPAAPGLPEALRIEVHSGLRLSARLLDPAGAPCAGATVVMIGQIGLANGSTAMGWTARTDVAGVLRLGCLLRGQPVAGFVSIDGAFVPFLCASPDRDLDLGDRTLAAAGRIEGHVLGADGAPLAGVVVRVCPVLVGPEVENLQQPFCQLREVVTNAAGRFAFNQLLPGPHRLLAQTLAEGAVVVPAEAGASPAPCAVQLPAGPGISGVVLGRDGRPAVDVAVLLISGDESMAEATAMGCAPFQDRTDAAGRFAFRGLPHGSSWRVQAGTGLGGTPIEASLDKVAAGSKGIELRLAPSGR